MSGSPQRRVSSTECKLPATSELPPSAAATPLSLTISHSPTGDLCLSLPSHNLILPSNPEKAIRTIHRLLTSIEVAEELKKKQTLGTNAKPIQEMMEKYYNDKEIEKQIAYDKGLVDLANDF